MDEYSMSDGLRARSGAGESRIDQTKDTTIANEEESTMTREYVYEYIAKAAATQGVTAVVSDDSVILQGGNLHHAGIGVRIEVVGDSLVIRPTAPKEKRDHDRFFDGEFLFPINDDGERVLVLDLTPIKDLDTDAIMYRVGKAIKTMIRLMAVKGYDSVYGMDTLSIDMPVGVLWNDAWRRSSHFAARYILSELHKLVDTVCSPNADTEKFCHARTVLTRILGYDPMNMVLGNGSDFAASAEELKRRIEASDRFVKLREGCHGAAGYELTKALKGALAHGDRVTIGLDKENTTMGHTSSTFDGHEFAAELAELLPVDDWAAVAEGSVVVATASSIGLGLRIEMESDTISIAARPVAFNGDAVGWDSSGHVALAHMLFPESMSVNVCPTGSQIPAMGQLDLQGQEWVIYSKEHLLARQLVEVIGNVLELKQLRYGTVFVLRDLQNDMDLFKVLPELPIAGNSWQSLYEGVRRLEVVDAVEQAWQRRVDRAVEVIMNDEAVDNLVRTRLTRPIEWILEGSDSKKLVEILTGKTAPKPNFGEVVKTHPRYDHSFDRTRARIKAVVDRQLVPGDRDPQRSTEERIRTALTTNFLGRYGTDRHDGEILVVAEFRDKAVRGSGKAERQFVRSAFSFLPRFYRGKELRVEMSGGESVITRIKLGTPRLPFAQARAASLANALGKSQHVTLEPRSDLGKTTLNAGGGRTMEVPLAMVRLTRQTAGAHQLLNNEGGLVRHGAFSLRAKRTVVWYGEFTPNGEPADWAKAVGTVLDTHRGEVRIGTAAGGDTVVDKAFGVATIVEATTEIDETTGAERKKVVIESDGQLPDGMKLFAGGSKVTVRVAEYDLGDFLYEDGTPTKADIIVALDKAMGKHWDVRSAIPGLLYTWGLKSERWVRERFDFANDWAAMVTDRFIESGDTRHIEDLCQEVCEMAGVRRDQLPVTVGHDWVELPLPILADSHIPAYTCALGRNIISTHPGVSVVGVMRGIYRDAVAKNRDTMTQLAAWLSGQWEYVDGVVTLADGTTFKTRRPMRVLEFTREGGTFLDPDQKGGYRLREAGGYWTATDALGNVIPPNVRAEGLGLQDTILGELADDECWVIPADAAGTSELIRGRRAKVGDTCPFVGMDLRKGYETNYMVIFPAMAKALRNTTRNMGKVLSVSRIVTELNALIDAGMYREGVGASRVYGEGAPGHWIFNPNKIQRLVNNLLSTNGVKSLKALALREMHECVTPKLAGARVVADADHRIAVDTIAIDPAWLEECARQEKLDARDRAEGDFDERKSRVASNSFFVKEGDVVLAARYPIEAENGYVALRVVKGRRYMTPSPLPRAEFSPQTLVALMRGDRDGDQIYLMAMGTPGTALADEALAEHGIDSLHTRAVGAAMTFELTAPERLADPGYAPLPTWKPLAGDRFSTESVAEYASIELSMKRFVAEVTGHSYHEKLRRLASGLGHAGRVLWSLLVNGAVDKYQEGAGVEAIDVIESIRKPREEVLTRQRLIPRLVEWSDHAEETAARNAELAYSAYLQLRAINGMDPFRGYPTRKAILAFRKAAASSSEVYAEGKADDVLRFIRRLNLDGGFADRIIEFIDTGMNSTPQVLPYSVTAVFASPVRASEEENLRTEIREFFETHNVRGIYTGLRNEIECLAAEIAQELGLVIGVVYPVPGWDKDHPAELKARRAAIKASAGYYLPGGDATYPVKMGAAWHMLQQADNLLAVGDVSSDTMYEVVDTAHADNMTVTVIERKATITPGSTMVFTGHREFVGDDDGQGDEAKRVRKEIIDVLDEHKPAKAILGGSYGADQLALETILDWRDAGNDTQVVVVFPYETWGHWHQRQTVRRRDAAIDRGVTVEYALERNMGNNSPTLRDHYMVERGDWILAVWSSDWCTGAGQTVSYGQERGLAYKSIWVEQVKKDAK